jgi:hypothetical protein
MLIVCNVLLFSNHAWCTSVLIVLALVIAASPLLAQGLLLILGLLSMWLIVPLFFSPHGIYMRRQNVFLIDLYQLTNGAFYFTNQQFICAKRAIDCIWAEFSLENPLVLIRG